MRLLLANKNARYMECPKIHFHNSNEKFLEVENLLNFFKYII